MRTVIASAACIMGFACASAQRPVQFQTNSPVQRSVSAAVLELGKQGLQTSSADAESGVIHTRWQDTGMLFGKMAGVPTTVAKRYTVWVQPAGNHSSVLVRVETRRCMIGLADTEHGAGCEALEILVGDDQKDLDRLGSQLRQAINQGPTGRT